MDARQKRRQHNLLPVETLVFTGKRVVPAASLMENATARVAAPRHGATAAASTVPSGEVMRRVFADTAAEVERFGASGLDARAHKAWEAKRLTSLGMHAPKRPRIPANIGFGMAKKATERLEAARLADAAVNGKLQGKRKLQPPPPRRGRGAAGAATAGGDRFAGGVLRLVGKNPRKEETQHVPRLGRPRASEKGRAKTKTKR